MKRFYTLFTTLLVFLAFGQSISAQTFSVAADTVYIVNPIGPGNKFDNITPASGCVTLNWRVIFSNFPADWLGSANGICDNNLCTPLSFLWPSMAMHKSNSYCVSGSGAFHLQYDLDSVITTGTYMVTVKLADSANVSDNATETFVVTKNYRTDVPAVRNTAISDFSLYPNPATNEVNVVFDASADVKNIAIFNIIGKMAAIYKVNGNSANLNLDNIPSGIYFVRLVNSQGNVIGTKKFSKQ